MEHKSSPLRVRVPFTPLRKLESNLQMSKNSPFKGSQELLQSRIQNSREIRRPFLRDKQTAEFISTEMEGSLLAKDFVSLLFSKHKEFLKQENMSKQLMVKCKKQLVRLLAKPSQQELDLLVLDNLTAQHGLLGLILFVLRRLNEQENIQPVSLQEAKKQLQKLFNVEIKKACKYIEDKHRGRLNQLVQKQLDSISLLNKLKQVSVRLKESESRRKQLEERVSWLQKQRVRQFLSNNE